MDAPPHPLPRARLLGAVVAASVIASLALEGVGPSRTYALLTPLLAACGGWLSWRLTAVARVEVTALAYGGLMLFPALSLRGILTLVSFDESAYVDVYTPVSGLLLGTQQACVGLSPLLLAAAVAPALLWGRRAAPGLGALTGAAAGAAAGKAAVDAAIEALRVGAIEDVARWTAAFPYAGLLALLGALLGWLALGAGRRIGPVQVLTVGVGVAAALATTPPLAVVEAGLPGGPAARPGVPLPTGAPGLPVARAPRMPDELGQLAEGFAVAERPRWPCMSRTDNWSGRPRATAVVALPPDATTALLDEAMSALAPVHVHRISILGRSDQDLPGPLAAWLRWPTVSLLLDRPPPGARWAALGDAGLEWAGPAPQPGERAICAVLPLTSATIQEVWDLGRSLQDGGVTARCAALAWVPPQWRPAAPPPDLGALSCAPP